MKKVTGLVALTALFALPLMAQAEGREGNHHFGGSFDHGNSSSFDAPEIDGSDLVVGMTLLAGVVGLVRRRAKAE